MRRPPQRRRFLAAVGAAWLLSGRAVVAAGAEALPGIDDLRKLGAQSRRERLPLLLFFSLRGCPHCVEVRRNYLAPRVAQGSVSGVIVREVDIASTRTFAGDDGRPLGGAELARRFNVRMAPVVILVDGDLRPLAEPLVGIDRSGFYEAYLAAAIETARAGLASA